MIKWAGKKGNLSVKGSFPVCLSLLVSSTLVLLFKLEIGKRERKIWRRLNILITSIHYRWGRDLIGCIALHACSTGMMVRPCTYICSEGCSYAQHQSCEMLSASQELQSLFHPPHTLTIHRQLRDDINLMCDACREEYCDFTRLIFRYDECNFQLDMCREFNQNPNLWETK